MTKHYCDLCGKESDDLFDLTLVKKTVNPYANYQPTLVIGAFCGACVQWITAACRCPCPPGMKEEEVGAKGAEKINGLTGGV